MAASSSSSTTAPSALLSAARAGDVGRVEKLLNKGANVEERDSAGAGALHLCCASSGNVKVVRGGCMEHTTVQGTCSPSPCLVYHPQAELLLSAGANVNAQDAHSHTPLLRAAEAGHSAMVEALAKVANTDLKVRQLCVFVEVVLSLTHSLPACSLQDKFGRSPLHW